MSTFKAEKREGKGKYAAFNLRKQGRIPGVIYGKGLAENVNIALDLKEFVKLLHAGDRIVDLDLDGSPMRVLIKAVQHGTYDHEILHADFRVVSDDEVIEVVLEIELTGDAVGVGQGGMLEQNLHQINTRCLPRNLPEKVVLNVEKMDLGDILYVEDLPRLDGVEYVVHGNPAVVSCHEPSSGEGESEGDEEAPAAPEVIGEKEREAKAKEKDAK